MIETCNITHFMTEVYFNTSSPHQRTLITYDMHWNLRVLLFTCTNYCSDILHPKIIFSVRPPASSICQYANPVEDIYGLKLCLLSALCKSLYILYVYVYDLISSKLTSSFRTLVRTPTVATFRACIELFVDVEIKIKKTYTCKLQILAIKNKRTANLRSL